MSSIPEQPQHRASGAERDFEKSLPVCSVCGGKCRGRYTVANGKNFCSERCFESALPVCSVCGGKCRSHPHTPEIGPAFCGPPSKAFAFSANKGSII